MKLFLIRHGEAKVMENDAPLTKKGLEQSKAVAQRLKNYEFDEIFCSDLTRAKQTCEEYLKLTNKKANYTEDLREIYRVIVGGSEKEGTSEGREERDKKIADQIFNQLSSKKGKNILIFTHGNLIRYFITKSTNFDPKKSWDGLKLHPSSISIINFENEKTTIKTINSISHLPKEEKESFFSKEKIDQDYLP